MQFLVVIGVLCGLALLLALKAEHERLTRQRHDALIARIHRNQPKEMCCVTSWDADDAA